MSLNEQNFVLGCGALQDLLQRAKTQGEALRKLRPHNQDIIRVDNALHSLYSSLIVLIERAGRSELAEHPHLWDE